MSSPKFMHKGAAVVKITTAEKVGNPSKPVASFYVNQKTNIHNLPSCGKLLWKNLWTMWKTIGFQQVFRSFTQPRPHVEKSVYGFA
jgi:hypothetical protein